MSDYEILRHRMATGIILEGASGISPSAWTDLLSRVSVNEGVAATISPYPPHPSHYLSTQSHGLSGSLTTIAMQANHIVWTPFWTPYGFTTRSMGVYVAAAQPGSNLVLGLYDRNGEIVAEFGSVDAAAVGWKIAALTVDVSVPAGPNWLAVHSGGTTNVGISGLTDGRCMFHHAPDYGSARGWNKTATLPMPATMAPDWVTDAVPLLLIEVRP